MLVSQPSHVSITLPQLSRFFLNPGSFWTYEAAKNGMRTSGSQDGSDSKIMLCGGLAGVATWASIYPLDVIKTRIQGSRLSMRLPRCESLMSDQRSDTRLQLSTWATARMIYLEGGMKAFFQGFVACSSRAFIVNAVQVWQGPSTSIYQILMCYSGIFTRLSCASDQ